MQFSSTSVHGAWLINLCRRGDDRGFFARLFCAEEFGRLGLMQDFPQINTSASARRGTLRGLHYQIATAAEVKVVRCIRGGLWDVVLDLRPDSPTHGRWFGAELNADNRTMMYVPRGCAHGFVTLADDTEALYLVSHPYSAEAERGIRWNDPAFSLRWPLSPVELSAKDASWPDFNAGFHATASLRGLA